MDVDLVIRRLGEIAGHEHVVTHPHQLRTYESDGLLQYRVSPRAVVLPGSAPEVRKLCGPASRPGFPGSPEGQARASPEARFRTRAF